MTRPTKREQIEIPSIELDDATLIDPAAVRAARDEELVPEELIRLSEMFLAIADPTRLRILAALNGRSMYVSDLVQVVGRTQSAVSHQLRVFRDAGLVKSEREGRRVLYSLDDAHIETLFASARDHVRHQRNENLKIDSREEETLGS